VVKEYIEREAINHIIKTMKLNFAPDVRPIFDAVNSSIKTYVPNADVEPIRYGKWIPASTKPGVHAGMKCSLCKARISYSEHFNGQHLYCHKCGAKMTKDKEPEYTFTTYAGVPGYEATNKE
jgi:hypothetical protein